MKFRSEMLTLDNVAIMPTDILLCYGMLAGGR